MKKVLLLFFFVSLCVSNMYGKTKTSYRNALIFAYSQANSVFEDDNIRLEIYNEQLWAKNKTKKTIFIDLSQCFMVHNGSSFPLFDKKQDERHASKKGKTTSIDEFITIPPSTGGKQNDTFICNMATGILGNYSTSETPAAEFTEYDKRLFNLIADLLDESKKADPKREEYKGTVSRHLTEYESINNIGASIAYAFNKRSEEWTSVALSAWVSDIIFSPYYVEMPDDLTKKDKRGFGVKETKPAVLHVMANSPFEFDEDRSPIIVCDWEGNFKKGTFRLSSTNVSKQGKVGIGRIIGAIFTYGATLLVPLSETSYKKVIHFDGATSDWGKMTYVGRLQDTKQEKK